MIHEDIFALMHSRFLFLVQFYKPYLFVTGHFPPKVNFAKISDVVPKYQCFSTAVSWSL
jgi:hypothetical protein